MTKLALYRFNNEFDGCLGLLYLDNKFECFTLEDKLREKKIAGKTAIPHGIYDLKLRNAGPKNDIYTKRFPKHKGMLWLQDVSNFKWVYIHIGNHPKDTSGCILVGDNVHRRPAKVSVSSSTSAYLRLYEKIIDKIIAGDSISLEIF